MDDVTKETKITEPSQVSDECPTTAASEHFKDYEMHGWEPDPNLPDDDNYMDMVMLVTRNSHCRQGSMACVLVAPPSPPPDSPAQHHPKRRRLYDAILSVSTNLPFYSAHDSDVHAEVAALGRAARNGVATHHATAFITMPPCKKCFSALTVAGIARIVTRLAVPPPIAAAATQHGIQMVQLEGGDAQRDRLNLLIHGNAAGTHSLADQEDIEEKRKRRKQQRQELKLKKHKPTSPT